MATLLESVEAAITAIVEGAQSITVSGRSWTKADLPTLWKMRRELTTEADLASGDSPMFVRGRVTGLGGGD
jgi:hypothetical protein